MTTAVGLDEELGVDAPDFRMIVTDVDGTLLGATVTDDDIAEFRSAMNEFRRRYNAVWVVITGRTLASYEAVSARFSSADCRPDFVVTRTSRVHIFSPLGYRPHLQATWGLRQLSRRDRRRVNRVMKDLRRTVSRAIPNVRLVRRDEGGTVYQFRNMDDVPTAKKLMTAEISGCIGMKILEHTHEVEVVPVYYEKGYCVRAIAAILNISPDQILAVADGRRDLSMVEPATSRWAGCPANAVPEMRSFMRIREGILSARITLAGVTDVMLAHMDGRWSSSSEEEPDEERVAQPWGRISIRHEEGRTRTDYLLVGLGCYAVLASLAHFGVVPGASLILLPFRLLQKVFS